jgi:Xaa-Pro aminopeptidase
MAFSGSQVPERVARVWETVRDARDAAVAAIRGAAAAGRPVAGYEGDRAARGVIEAAGFGPRFVHRTGHSIDRNLHGSGPHLDDYETHDDRALVPGVGFSVEPGIYLAGEFGVRSELNMYWGPSGPEVTPRHPQTALITAPLPKTHGQR